MRITTKGRYALRAILYLVTCSESKPISVKFLSRETCLSPEFLEQIFFKLRKADIIKSTRGPGGGFTFDRDPSEVSINDLFTAVDEGYHVTPCTEENTKNTECGYSSQCIACDFWKHTNRMLISYFSSVSIQDIIDQRYPEILSITSGDPDPDSDR